MKSGRDGGNGDDERRNIIVGYSCLMSDTGRNPPGPCCDSEDDDGCETGFILM